MQSAGGFAGFFASFAVLCAFALSIGLLRSEYSTQSSQRTAKLAKDRKARREPQNAELVPAYFSHRLIQKPIHRGHRDFDRRRVAPLVHDYLLWLTEKLEERFGEQLEGMGFVVPAIQHQLRRANVPRKVRERHLRQSVRPDLSHSPREQHDRAVARLDCAEEQALVRARAVAKESYAAAVDVTSRLKVIEPAT